MPNNIKRLLVRFILIPMTGGGICLLLVFCYYRFYPDNFDINRQAYQNLVEYLLQSKIEGTLWNSRDKNICQGVNKCDCLEQECLINNKNIYDIMDDLGVEHIDIIPSGGVVRIYPSKRWWSASMVSYNYGKGQYNSIDSKKIPFYRDSNRGWIYDRKMSNDWVMIRPKETRLFYLYLNFIHIEE